MLRDGAPPAGSSVESMHSPIDEHELNEFLQRSAVEQEERTLVLQALQAVIPGVKSFRVRNVVNVFPSSRDGSELRREGAMVLEVSEDESLFTGPQWVEGGLRIDDYNRLLPEELITRLGLIAQRQRQIENHLHSEMFLG